VSLQFKHALVQDAAYATLLRSRRQELHARIARVLEEAFPETVETQPELLAHHYTQAGLTEQAIDYWQRAGERALTRSANLEASRHFCQGIELIKSLSPSLERTRREFRLYMGLGPATRAIKGYAAPETQDTFTRARELIDADTSLPEQMLVLYGLWGVHIVRVEHEAGRKAAEQALRLVARDADTGAEPQAHANRLMGESLLVLGEFAESRQYLERAIAFCDSDRATVTDLRFSFDHKVTALGFLALRPGSSRAGGCRSDRGLNPVRPPRKRQYVQYGPVRQDDSGRIPSRYRRSAQVCRRAGGLMRGIRHYNVWKLGQFWPRPGAVLER
jgi:tetratricopeptide (TPR) repeat protein